jgi:CubicO group peptidase (beta-lactamase class C family)
MAVGTARSIAKVYGNYAGALGAGGRRLGLTQATTDLLSQRAPPARDQVMGSETAFSLGFLKPCPALRFGTSDHAFGMHAAGGLLGFGDPQAQIGFAYTPNRLLFGFFSDPRAKALCDVLNMCLAAVTARAAQ